MGHVCVQFVGSSSNANQEEISWNMIKDSGAEDHVVSFAGWRRFGVNLL